VRTAAALQLSALSSVLLCNINLSRIFSCSCRCLWQAEVLYFATGNEFIAPMIAHGKV
jgi:hypothetical protein